MRRHLLLLLLLPTRIPGLPTRVLVVLVGREVLLLVSGSRGILLLLMFLRRCRQC